MRLRFFAPLVFCALTASASFAEVSSDRCDLSSVKRIDELQARLQNRAVEAVNLAAAGIEEKGLKHVNGFNALVKHMDADTYRFLNWDYMPAAVPDPCGIHEVNVEFIRSADKELFPVKFTFNSGKIVSAVGWSRSFSTGLVKPVRN